MSTTLWKELPPFWGSCNLPVTRLRLLCVPSTLRKLRVFYDYTLLQNKRLQVVKYYK